MFVAELWSWSLIVTAVVVTTVTYPPGSAAICVKMFEDRDYRGSSMDACAENAECITLPEHFRDVTSSIGMEGNRCVTLYDRVECEGNSITVGDWETCGPSDLSDKYGQWSLIFRSGCNHPTRGSFNDEARSIRIHH